MDFIYQHKSQSSSAEELGNHRKDRGPLLPDYRSAPNSAATDSGICQDKGLSLNSKMADSPFQLKGKGGKKPKKISLAEFLAAGNQRQESPPEEDESEHLPEQDEGENDASVHPDENPEDEAVGNDEEGDDSEDMIDADDSWDEYDEPLTRKKGKAERKKAGGIERYNLMKHNRRGKIPENAGKPDIQTMGLLEAHRLKMIERRDIEHLKYPLPLTDAMNQGILSNHIRTAPSVISVATEKTHDKKKVIGFGKSKDRHEHNLNISPDHRKGINKAASSGVNTVVSENWDILRCGEHEAMSNVAKGRNYTLTGFKKKKPLKVKNTKMTAVRAGIPATTPPCSRCNLVFKGADVSPEGVDDIGAYKSQVKLVESARQKPRLNKGKIKRKLKPNKWQAKESRRNRLYDADGDDTDIPLDNEDVQAEGQNDSDNDTPPDNAKEQQKPSGRPSVGASGRNRRNEPKKAVVWKGAPTYNPFEVLSEEDADE